MYTHCGTWGHQLYSGDNFGLNLNNYTFWFFLKLSLINSNLGFVLSFFEKMSWNWWESSYLASACPTQNCIYIEVEGVFYPSPYGVPVSAINHPKSLALGVYMVPFFSPLILCLLILNPIVDLLLHCLKAQYLCSPQNFFLFIFSPRFPSYSWNLSPTCLLSDGPAGWSCVQGCPHTNQQEVNYLSSPSISLKPFRCMDHILSDPIFTNII